MNQSVDQSAEAPIAIEPGAQTDTQAGAAADGANEAPTPKLLFLTVFPSIMLPMFLAVADQTIVATALPTIASNLGEIQRASWVVVSYLIANTIAAPVYGRLGDTFGRRSMMIMALTIFMVGLGAVRAFAQYRMADGVSRAAGIWRRRADDSVASADRGRPFRRASAAAIRAILPAYRSVPAPSVRSPAAT